MSNEERKQAQEFLPVCHQTWHAGHYNQPVRTVKHTSATFHRLWGSSATGPDRLLEKGSSDSVGKITWSGRAFAVARVTRPRLNPEHPDSWCARKNGELLQSADVTAGTRPSTHTQGWGCSHGASTTDWPTVGEDWSALNLTFQKVFPQNSCEKPNSQTTTTMVPRINAFMDLHNHPAVLSVYPTSTHGPCGCGLHLWYPEGNVWFVKPHSQEERPVLLHLALQ